MDLHKKQLQTTETRLECLRLRKGKNTSDNRRKGTVILELQTGAFTLRQSKKHPSLKFRKAKPRNADTHGSTRETSIKSYSFRNGMVEWSYKGSWYTKSSKCHQLGRPSQRRQREHGQVHTRTARDRQPSSHSLRRSCLRPRVPKQAAASDLRNLVGLQERQKGGSDLSV